MSDELEARLRRADPVGPDAVLHPADGPEAAILRRTIMNADDTVSGASTTNERDNAAVAMPLWRRPLVISAVGAAAAAAVVITVVAVSNNGGSTPEASTVTYLLGTPDPMMMCLPIDMIQPVAGAAALSGTVVSIEGNQVVLDVDRWYAGGDADRVQLTGTPESVALDGVEFVVGEEYFVTAAEGVVQPCGVSGAASPELEQAYDEWYG